MCSEAAPEGRLREAARNGDAASAIVQVKHFTKSLHSSQLTQPAQVCTIICTTREDSADCAYQA